MTGAGLLVSLRAMLKRWIKLVPDLFRHDPLFRYATSAAVLALIFLAVSMVQDDSRYGAVGGMEGAPGPKATATARTRQGKASAPAGPRTAEPPAPGSSPDDARPLNIAPGRSIEGVDLAPAPHDDFGTLPRKETP